MKKVIVLVLLLALVVLLAVGVKLFENEGSVLSAQQEAQPAEDTPSEESDAVLCRFSTTDINGSAVDSGIFADYELTMINFWEPWCGPCVSEMPDLQKLYENYSDKGFLLLGVFSTAEGAADTVSSTGVQYPILNYSPDFDYFQTGYVPNTIIVNAQGEMVGGPYIGARSYEDWAAIVEGLL